MFGIFDSGVGGLSVYRLLKDAFPKAGFLYLGDTARFPYGEKSKETIKRFAYQNARFLLSQGADVIIIACHTASSLAADYLKRELKGVPIYDVITPAVHKAVKMEFQRIGVVGTRATISSGIYKKKLLCANAKIKIFEQPSPLLVSLIEEGWVRRPETNSVLEHYLVPLKKKRIDSLIISCTHYSLIKPQIKKVLGNNIALIDPAEELAKELQKADRAKRKTYPFKRGQRDKFWVTDSPDHFKRLSKLFLDKATQVRLAKIP